MEKKLRARCPKCERKLGVPPDRWARPSRCPKCQTTFVPSEHAVDDDPAGQTIESLLNNTLADASREENQEPFPPPTLPPPARPPLPATIGRFEIRAILGEGGFGIVYHAFDPSTNREIALKVPRASTTDERSLSRFVREARSAGSLDHPGIVRVYDASTQDGSMYIASQLIRGKPLKEEISARRFTPREAAEMVAKIAHALSHAHRSGVMHRDVKPNNILLDENGDPKLTDFGLAKRQDTDDTITVDGSLLGTPAYMSPEQVEGHGDEASDQYSLGVILYELLSGRRPFNDPPPMIYVSILQHDPPSLEKLVPGIPDPLVSICRRAMAKSPRDRYESVEAMGRDLVCWLAGRDTSLGQEEERTPIVSFLTRPEVFASAGLGIALTVAGWVGLQYMPASAPKVPAQIAIPKEPNSKPKTTSKAIAKPTPGVDQTQDSPPPEPTEARAIPVADSNVEEIPSFAANTLSPIAPTPPVVKKVERDPPVDLVTAEPLLPIDPEKVTWNEVDAVDLATFKEIEETIANLKVEEKFVSVDDVNGYIATGKGALKRKLDKPILLKGRLVDLRVDDKDAVFYVAGATIELLSMEDRNDEHVSFVNVVVGRIRIDDAVDVLMKYAPGDEVELYCEGRHVNAPVNRGKSPKRDIEFPPRLREFGYELHKLPEEYREHRPLLVFPSPELILVRKTGDPESALHSKMGPRCRAAHPQEMMTTLPGLARCPSQFPAEPNYWSVTGKVKLLTTEGDLVVETDYLGSPFRRTCVIARLPDPALDPSWILRCGQTREVVLRGTPICSGEGVFARRRWQALESLNVGYPSQLRDFARLIACATLRQRSEGDVPNIALPVDPLLADCLPLMEANSVTPTHEGKVESAHELDRVLFDAAEMEGKSVTVEGLLMGYFSHKKVTMLMLELTSPGMAAVRCVAASFEDHLDLDLQEFEAPPGVFWNMSAAQRARLPRVRLTGTFSSRNAKQFRIEDPQQLEDGKAPWDTAPFFCPVLEFKSMELKDDSTVRVVAGEEGGNRAKVDRNEMNSLGILRHRLTHGASDHIEGDFLLTFVDKGEFEVSDPQDSNEDGLPHGQVLCYPQEGSIPNGRTVRVSKISGKFYWTSGNLEIRDASLTVKPVN